MFALWHYYRPKFTFHFILTMSVFAINEVHLLLIFIYKESYLFSKSPDCKIQ